MRRTLTGDRRATKGNGQRANGSDSRRHAGSRLTASARVRYGLTRVLEAPCRQARMQVVATWTGSSADALRQALRMTNESYAEHLGVAVRTVAYWRKKSETVPQTAIQETLDAALERAPDRAKAQFAALVGEAQGRHARPPVDEQPFGASLAPDGRAGVRR